MKGVARLLVSMHQIKTTDLPGYEVMMFSGHAGRANSMVLTPLFDNHQLDAAALAEKIQCNFPLSILQPSYCFAYPLGPGDRRMIYARGDDSKRGDE
mmetsp:Transcript_6053/g.13716  ORF Transcript_6053/g.13716 Transcript_6053/m.13716 type:complete len:97 (+) Transcript_6053:331-621(+)